MTEEQERNIRRRKLSECVTSNEDLLCRVLSYCTAEHLGTSAIFVNQLWSDAGKNDSIWRSISLRRWKGMRNERMWISRSTKKEDTTKWFDCYKKSVKEIRRTIPIFAMGCRLEQGMGMVRIHLSHLLTHLLKYSLSLSLSLSHTHMYTSRD